MGEDGQADSTDPGIDIRSLVLVAVFSLIAIAPVYTFSLSLQTLFDTSVTEILHAILPLLLAIPVPAAYVATISKQGFRREAFGTLVVLPFAFINTRLAAVAAGIILGSIMVSYKAKSIYNDRNANWVHFKAAGSMVTILAITVGLATASFYAGSPTFREDIRSNLTQHSVDTAMEYANLADLGGTGEAAQADMVSQFAGTLAENISTASIQSTETIVFAAVQEARNQDSNSFDADERTVLRAAFDTAQGTVPGNVSRLAEQQVQDQFGAVEDTGSTSTDTIRSMVTPRVQRFTNQIITDSREMAAAAFIAAFSIVMLFKLPFEFLSAIYAAVLSRIFQ